MLLVKDLSHRYPHCREFALDQVNLQIAQGETIGLLGPNGAGKTTLMSLLCGLQSVQQGQIFWQGVAFANLPKKERHQISLVPQDFAFYPLLTVAENMAYFASLYGIRDKSYLNQLLARVELTSHRDKLGKQLSGGLKRRLNFAIGLINRPKMIFLDEITVGIDPESRQFILESVEQLHAQGVTVIYTSHYLQEIEQLCQRLVLLAKGKLIYQGEIAKILQQDRVLTLRTMPALGEQALQQYAGKRQIDGSIQLPIDNKNPLAVGEMLQRLTKQGYRVLSYHFGKQSLEQFYLNFLQQSEKVCSQQQ